VDGVVVGVDGSPRSVEALGWALDEASALGVAVEAVCTWQTPRRLMRSAQEAPPEQAADELLRTALAQALSQRTRPSPEIRSALVCGHPAGVLVERSADALLLVVGNRGAGLATGLRLGSISDHVARAAACPVSVVYSRPDLGPHRGRVVVGLDGSAAAEQALHAAVEAARRHDCALHVVHAWQTMSIHLGRSVDPPLLEPADLVGPTGPERLLEVARSLLGEDPGVPMTAAVRDDEAWRAVVACAYPHDLLVLGTRGLGGVPGLVLGRTTREALHSASCTVHVVRARGKE
jgi:nucleotide-binding universal stress UspA family protein